MELTGDDRSAVHGRTRLARLAGHGRSPIAVHRFWGRAVLRLASSLLPIGPTIITPRPSLAGAHRNPGPGSLADPGLAEPAAGAETTTRATVTVPYRRQSGSGPSIVLTSHSRISIEVGIPYVRSPTRWPTPSALGARGAHGRASAGGRGKTEESAEGAISRGTDVPLARRCAVPYRFAERPRISIYRDARRLSAFGRSAPLREWGALVTRSPRVAAAASFSYCASLRLQRAAVSRRSRSNNDAVNSDRGPILPRAAPLRGDAVWTERPTHFCHDIYLQLYREDTSLRREFVWIPISPPRFSLRIFRRAILGDARSLQRVTLPVIPLSREIVSFLPEI